MKVLQWLFILLLIAGSVNAQSKKIQFSATNEQKDEIRQINETFRTKNQQLVVAEKDPLLRRSRLAQLRAERDSSLLVLLGEEQFVQYKKVIAPQSNPENSDAKLVGAEASRQKKLLKLTAKQAAELEQINLSFLKDRKKVIVEGKEPLYTQIKLDSLNNIKEQRLRNLLSDDQFRIYKLSLTRNK